MTVKKSYDMSGKDVNHQKPDFEDISGDEIERLKRNMHRSDFEKLRLFTRMLKRNNLIKKAKFIHKP